MKQVLYFTAKWCQPCKKVRPVVEQMISEGLGNFLIIDIDDDDSIKLIKKYQLKSVPTFILLNNDNEIARITGAHTREQLEDFIKN